jgi:hypothetical protein
MSFAVKRGRPESFSETDRGEFRRVSEDVFAVYKRDLEISPGALDRNRRLGGWGGISGDIEGKVGGRWTSRSLGVINGLAARVS